MKGDRNNKNRIKYVQYHVSNVNVVIFNNPASVGILMLDGFHNVSNVIPVDPFAKVVDDIVSGVATLICPNAFLTN